MPSARAQPSRESPSTSRATPAPRAGTRPPARAGPAPRSTRTRRRRCGRRPRRAQRSVIARGFAQLEALDLAGGGLRQLADEADLARILVRRELVLDEGLQRFGERVVACVARLQHDVRERAREAAFVLADDRGLEHRLVPHERRLDLERRHELAADLQHVVAASRVGVAAVGVAHVLVAAARPLALERRARLFARSPST